MSHDLASIAVAMAGVSILAVYCGVKIIECVIWAVFAVLCVTVLLGVMVL
jgi:hypothetical protein